MSGERLGGGGGGSPWVDIAVSSDDAKTPIGDSLRNPTLDTYNLIMKSLENESDPLLQLDNIRTMSTFLKHTHLGEAEAKELSSKLESISSRDDNAPLVALSLTYLRGCIAKDYLHDDSFKVKMSKYFLDDLVNRAQLHRDYPELPEFSVITRIAPNVACSLNDYHDIESVATKGAAKTTSESTDPAEYPFLDILDRDANAPLWLLTFAHDVRFRGLIEEKIGLNLADIPLDSQMRLLEFMTKSDNAKFDRLCATLNNLESGQRLKLAEGFLAADFGEDFGDALLEIADSPRVNGEQLEKMLDEFNTCRASIRKITGLYKGYDGGEFTKEYARAASERLTDALMVFREIARRGEANAELGWFGEAGFDYASALEALEYEAKSLEIISGTLGDVTAGVKGAFAEKFLHPDEQHGRSMYDFYSPEHGYVLLYTRPEGAGSFEPMLEYGKIRSKYDKNNNNSGVEASVSLIVNPVNPYSLPNPFRPDHRKVKDMGYYDHATMDKVSAIRLDREGRAPDARPDDPNRDPINDVGAISVDLAAINDRADTPSGKIARLFSVGNKLRSEDRARDSVGVRAGGAGGEVDTSLNHNTNWFDQGKYGVADGFSQLVGYVDRLATGWCASMPPQGNEGFTGMMRAVSRRRGAKVRRSA